MDDWGAIQVLEAVAEANKQIISTISLENKILLSITDFLGHSRLYRLLRTIFTSNKDFLTGLQLQAE